MAMRLSCLVHVLLLLLLGCAAHRAVVSPAPSDGELKAAKEFVSALEGKMPMWDTDAIASYERVQIATVKADIAMARQADQKDAFLADVSKLHADWDALVAWDEMLRKVSLI